MAKRKRLELPGAVDPQAADLHPGYAGMSRMPIADVAGDTAVRAALDEVTQALSSAEADGRMARLIAITEIDTHHLSRDRMALDPDEMETLQKSLATRGQQTPIDVLQLPSGRFGLISGLRRLEALRALGKTEALAFVRQPQTAAASYVAMVEENEIRAGLSFYERANIAVQAVDAGVYPDSTAAVKGLFAHVSAVKRSKILNFVALHAALGKHLSFPTRIPEKLGLALSAAVLKDKRLATRIKDALRKTPPVDAAAERRVLERALKPAAGPGAAVEEIAPGVALKEVRGGFMLSGASVNAQFLADLRAWIADR